MTMRTLDATITELSAGGEGVAICEIEGERRAVFVPGVIAGERARVEADASRRPARGRLLELLEPSPHRVTPACPHVARCGGCDWMHLSVAEQALAHAKIVRAALPAPLREIDIVSHAAPQTQRYRTRARVHIEARRGRVLVGMYGRRSRAPVAVDACIVLDPVLDQARRALATLLEGAKGRGEATLALGRERRAVIDMTFHGELPAATFGRLESAALAMTIAGARIRLGEVRIPATIGDPTPWIAGADGEPLRLAPGGFAQATETGNALLGRRAVELADALAPQAPTTELFAGAGNLTVLLARTRRVTAVEIDAEAAAAARKNLEARGLSARVVEADCTRHAIAKESRLVVLDPPRAGAREVAEALARRPVAAIVYVSCDPPTLGRDLTMLASAGYAPAAVETFEMFPQTSHVETLVALAPPRSRR